ncbi:MAG: hypothetical protein P4L61_00105, partial [Candidatus Pacebacteria bacterium]|nr:hypothetical protein [Candidatus Paceibacterota bacterium]
LKFKGELDKLTDAAEALLFELRNRSDQGFTEFVDANVIDQISGVVANIKSLEVYSDDDLEQTDKAIADLCSCIESVGIQAQRGGMNDDLDSLRSLIWKFEGMSEQAGNIEFASKQLGAEMKSALGTVELAVKLKESASEKAQYITQRAEALARYLG